MSRPGYLLLVAILATIVLGYGCNAIINNHNSNSSSDDGDEGPVSAGILYDNILQNNFGSLPSYNVLSINHNGTQVVLISTDSYYSDAFVYDIQTGRELYSVSWAQSIGFQRWDVQYYCATFSLDDSTLYLGGKLLSPVPGGFVATVRRPTGSFSFIDDYVASSVYSIAFNTDESQIFYSTEDGSVCRLRNNTLSIYDKPSAIGPSAAPSLTVSDDGAKLFVRYGFEESGYFDLDSKIFTAVPEFDVSDFYGFINHSYHIVGEMVENSSHYLAEINLPDSHFVSKIRLSPKLPPVQSIVVAPNSAVAAIVRYYYQSYQPDGYVTLFDFTQRKILGTFLIKQFTCTGNFSSDSKHFVIGAAHEIHIIGY